LLIADLWLLPWTASAPSLVLVPQRSVAAVKGIVTEAVATECDDN
jgi:hypothetical protein